jgi:hypothetical protein
MLFARTSIQLLQGQFSFFNQLGLQTTLSINQGMFCEYLELLSRLRLSKLNFLAYLKTSKKAFNSKSLPEHRNQQGISKHFCQLLVWSMSLKLGTKGRMLNE